MYSKIIVTPNYFPTQWCDNINNWMKNNVKVSPSLGRKGIRKCDVRMLEKGMKPYDGIFNSMMDFVKPNLHLIDVDIDYKISGGIQHITYLPGHEVGWHDDTIDMSSVIGDPEFSDLKRNRKISLTVMLSDRSEYEGGDFIFEPNYPLPIRRVEGKGTVAMFTSFSKHKVTEITSGVRNILFIFITGPNWR